MNRKEEECHSSVPNEQRRCDNARDYAKINYFIDLIWDMC